METFNPETNTFELLSEKMPIGAHFFGYTQLNDKILTIGFKSGNAILDPGPVYQMDPQTGKWSDTGIRTPTPINLFFVTVYNK